MYKKPFSMPYDTLEEIQMRLNGTVVLFDGEPVLIVAVKAKGNKKGEFNLHFKGYNDAAGRVHTYPSEKWDLYVPISLYTHFGSGEMAYWVSRRTERQYQQGANQKNTTYTRVGSDRPQGLHPSSILQALAKPCPVVQMSEQLVAYFSSAVLSPHVAIWKNAEGIIGVEYKGVAVGNVKKLEKGLYVLDTANESLSLNPWCQQRLEEVGIRLV